MKAARDVEQGVQPLWATPMIQVSPIMENQMEKKMENEMETGMIYGVI